ncbi:TetR/AcrR family transcriptional regulator [Bowmanella denitrificans]|uniref:TetR/AcrR family transcriptional regulator n=1 Tax=Bowmanella denitrificans TaxID=366582 RepID=A0ABN0XDN2_9ALTE
MSQRDAILDNALQLAEQLGWSRLNLAQVAATMTHSVAEVYRYFRDKDALAEAWFERADLAMLQSGKAADWANTDASIRLEQTIWAWLSALAPHRRLTRQMLYYKLEPGHLHLQLAGLLRISRTVQWIRDVAGLQAKDLRRTAQELFLSKIFVSTFVNWLWDESAGQRRSRHFLHGQLKLGNKLGLWR